MIYNIFSVDRDFFYIYIVLLNGVSKVLYVFYGFMWNYKLKYLFL